MSKRTFYRTIYTVTILSDKPMDDDLSLSDIECEITDGDCSGLVECGASEALTGAEAAQALIAQHSDPSFLGLTEDGEDEDTNTEERP
jgi:hypothetical protein